MTDWSKDTDADGNEIHYTGRWFLVSADGSKHELKWKFKGKQPSCDAHWKDFPGCPCWKLVHADDGRDIT